MLPASGNRNPSKVLRVHAEVERRLSQRRSPQRIAARLRPGFPDDPEMRTKRERLIVNLRVDGCEERFRVPLEPQPESDGQADLPRLFRPPCHLAPAYHSPTIGTAAGPLRKPRTA